MSEFKVPEGGDVEFKGSREQDLSANEEFDQIVRDWNTFTFPTRQIEQWLKNYGFHKVPINFAIALWADEKITPHRDMLWKFVREEFQNYVDVLEQHGATPEAIKDIKKRLGVLD